MATWTSAELLTRFNELSGRPSSSDSIADAAKYKRLADAQNVVLADAAARVPRAFYSKAAYGSTPTLTTTDQQVFTFGTDVNGDPLFPIGKFRIFENLSAIPDYPWVEGIDYLWEGTQIRIPNNATYGGTLYWRGIAPVLDISATNQPAIIPVSFRILIVYEAVRRYAEEGGRDVPLANRMQANYDATFAKYCLTLKTAYSNGGALDSVSGLNLTMLRGVGG
jgi:hypothetical protein